MEQWKKEVKALEEKRISFDLSYYRLAKMSGINIQKLKKVLEFKMIPNLKMYFDLKTVLDSHNVTVVGAEKVQTERTTTDETSFEEKGLSVKTRTENAIGIISEKPNCLVKKKFKFSPTMTSTENIQTLKNINDNAKSNCGCTLVGGLLRRGKDGCKKLKSEHKF